MSLLFFFIKKSISSTNGIIYAKFCVDPHMWGALLLAQEVIEVVQAATLKG